MRRTLALLALLPLAACNRPAPAPSTATGQAGSPAAADKVAAAPAGTVATEAPHAPAAPAAPTTPSGAKQYGAPLTLAGPAAPIASVLATPDANAGKPILVEGKVRANCTRKGCWMELASGMDKDKPGCRVTFKDYGFFVPTDSQGADARVEGVLAVRTIAAGEVAHLESEGGSFPSKLPDGSAKEVRIVATGVELKK